MPARVDVDGHDLVVTLSGALRVWGMRRRVRVPLADVTSASAVDRRGLRPPMFLLGATSLPGVIVAGALWSPGSGRELWAVRRADRVLSIATKGTWSRIVLEVDDPDADAARLMAH